MTSQATFSCRRPSITCQIKEEFYVYYGEDHNYDYDQKERSSVTGLQKSVTNVRYAKQSRFNQNNYNNNKVPKDVMKVLIHPCVKIIPNGTFSKCERLQEVQFGFVSSDWSIPTTDDEQADENRQLDPNQTNKQDNTNETNTSFSSYESQLETIGESAFSHCVSLKHIALPPFLKWIRKSAFEGCLTLLSVEVCQGLVQIDHRAFCDCYSLKNVAIPNTVEPILGKQVVTMRNYNNNNSTDLDDNDGEDSSSSSSLEDPLVRSLRKRFQHLPVHQLCYFFHQLYPNHVRSLRSKFQHLPTEDLADDTMEETAIVKLLDDAVATASKRQDGASACSTDAFGMTPLHILACSVRPNPKLLKVLLDHIYRTNDDSSSSSMNDAFSYSVLTKDSWGNYPIHYAVRCNAPLEIVKLLIDAQLAHHSSENATLDCNLEQPPHLRHRRKELPYWKGLLDLACNLASLPMTKFLLESSLKDRIDALESPSWKEDVLTMIHLYQDDHETKTETTPPIRPIRRSFQNQQQQQQQPKKALTAPRSRQQLIKAVEKRLEWYKFQESFSLLELAVWKAKLSSEATATTTGFEPNIIGENYDNDIMRTAAAKEDQQEEEEQFRETCRIHCGAELVTMNVLGFLGSFEDQQLTRWKKKKSSIPLLPTPNPWATVKALRHPSIWKSMRL